MTRRPVRLTRSDTLVPATTLLRSIAADHMCAKKPKVVVRCGAGASTLIVARAMQIAGGGTHIAFDQHAEFVEATGAWLADHGLSADLRAVPLVSAPGGW